MYFYISGVGGFKEYFDKIKNFNVRPLCTFANPKEFQNLYAANFSNIMLDSGAYTAYTQGKTINIDRLIKFIQENKTSIEIPISLDNLTNPRISFENFLYIKSNGIMPMPVYHYGEDLEWIEKYRNHTDYIGIGGLAAHRLNWKKIVPFLEKIFSRYKNTKFHIFGINSPKSILRFNIHSFDATTWLIGGKYFEIETRYGRIKLREIEDSFFWEWFKNEYGYTKKIIMSDNFKSTDLNMVNISEIIYIIENNPNPKRLIVKRGSLF